MNFTFDLDMQAIVNEATKPEALQPILQKAITKAIADVVERITGYNSEFRKSLEQQLSEALPRGLSIDDAAKLQQLVNATVCQAVSSENKAAVQAAIDKSVISAISKLPSSIKLSELIEVARGGFHKEKHESFYAHMEEPDNGFRHLYLDSSAPSGFGKSHYSARTQIDVDKDGNVYAMKLDGRQLTPLSLPNVISEFDAILMGMYVGRVKLVVDIDADDVAAAAEAQYD